MTSTTLTQITAAAGQDVPINANFQTVSPSALFGRRYGSGISGLVLGYYGGTFESNDIADGTVTLPASQATVYVVALKSTGAVSASTSNANWNDTTNYFRIGIGATGASTITSFSDKRQAYSAQVGSGGGVAGADKQIQYNDAGVMGAEAGFEYDKATNTMTVANITYTGLALTAASATGGAGARLPHGTAPSSPTNGDMWTTTSGLFVRINGATVGPLAAGLSNPLTTTGDIIYSSSGTTAARLGIGSTNQVLTVIGGIPSWQTPGTASLTNWTEAANSSAPNATIPVVSFSASNAATDIDVAIVSKGVGALTRNIANNASSGGNKRAQYAVDLQGQRSAADQVASGSNSVIGGGSSNKASGTQSTVGGGDTNTASNTAATVGGGASNSATATYATVVGGASNTASAAQATVLGGGSNAASASYALASGRNVIANGVYGYAGGYGSTSRSIIGAVTYSSYYNGSTVGKFQRGAYTLVARTTNATATAMTADNTAAGATNQLILDNFSTYAVRGLVSARKSTTNDYATWAFTACVTRDANAASTVVTSAAPTSIAASAGASTWVFAVSADTTNGGLRLTVTGAASSNITWTAALDTAESVEV